MSDRLTIRVEGDAAVQAAFDRIAATLADPAPLLERIGAVMEMNVQQRFELKTAPDGTHWAPLSAATVEIYESDWYKKRNPAFKSGIPGSLLERTGQMRLRLDHNVNGNVLELGFGSRKSDNGRWEVPMLHEFGTKKMPARRLLTADPEAGVLGAQDEADVLEEISAYLGERL